MISIINRVQKKLLTPDNETSKQKTAVYSSKETSTRFLFFDIAMPAATKGEHVMGIQPWKKLLRYLAVALPVLIFISACASSKPESVSAPVDVVEQKALRVGVFTNSPPLVYKRGDQIMGLEADLAKEFATFLKMPCQFVELDWEEQIPALNSGKIDIIMSGMTVTSLRQLRIVFSEPYLESGLTALVHAGDAERYKDLLSRKEEFYKIGVIRGTTGELFSRDTFPNSRIVTFSTQEKALTDLLYGTIDMIIHDMPMLYALMAQNESKGLTLLPGLFTSEYLAWGIRIEDQELLKKANAFLEGIDSEGKLAYMVKRWIPVLETR
jgi:polar amino acid transport system substrate-binding protein